MIALLPAQPPADLLNLIDRPMIETPGLVMLDHCVYGKTTCTVLCLWFSLTRTLI